MRLVGRAGGASRIPTRVGRYRRRRRGTPNADDNLVCVGMKIGFVAVSEFSERADSYYNGGGKSVKFRWPGDGCGEEGVSKGMEAFVRDSHVAETAGHRPCPNGVTITRVQHPVETPADQPPPAQVATPMARFSFRGFAWMLSGWHCQLDRRTALACSEDESPGGTIMSP